MESMIRKYIYQNNDDYYIIYNNGILYAYDYQQNLLAQTKKIELIRKFIFSNKKGICYFWVCSRRFVFEWNVYTNTLNKIQFTKQLEPEIYFFVEHKDRLVIYFEGRENKNAISKKILF